MSLRALREEERLQVRVRALKALKKGWLVGYEDSPPLSPSGLDWALGIIMDYTPWDAFRANLYPTPRGNLLVEWSIGRYVVEAEFFFSTKLVYLSWSYPSTNRSGHIEIPFQDGPDYGQISSLFQWIKDEVRQAKRRLAA